MPEDSANPYASPQTAAAEPPPAERFDRMPGSVKLAIGCFAVLAMLLALSLVSSLTTPGVPPSGLMIYLPQLAISLAALLGLRRRSQAARPFARFLAFVGAMMTVSFVLMLFTQYPAKPFPPVVTTMSVNGVPVPSSQLWLVHAVTIGMVAADDSLPVDPRVRVGASLSAAVF